MRRLLLLLTTGAVFARLVTLGAERGWALVGPIALRVSFTALAAYALHVVLHELGHLALALAMNFEVRAVRLGPLHLDLAARRLSWSGADLGGSITAYPRGLTGIRSRLRLVALGGPLMTALSTVLCWVSAGEARSSSAAGIWGVIGAVVLVTSLLPGGWLPRRPLAGTDLEQILGLRRVVAWWAANAVVQGLMHGQRCSSTATVEQLEALLPHPRLLEPLTLIELIVLAEHQAFTQVRSRLSDVWAALPQANPHVPDWLRGDVAGFAACFYALVDRDPLRASEARAIAQVHQALPWFAWLSDAAIAHAKNEPSDALTRWWLEAEKSPVRPVAVTANSWVLHHLGG